MVNNDNDNTTINNNEMCKLTLKAYNETVYDAAAERATSADAQPPRLPVLNARPVLIGTDRSISLSLSLYIYIYIYM